MKLGIDLSPFYTESKFRGIGRYARGLLQELIRINDTDQFHFLNAYGVYTGDPRMNRQCYQHNYSCGPDVEAGGGKLLMDDAAFSNFFHATIDHYLQSSKIDAMLFLSLMETNWPFQVEWFSGVFKIGILYDLIPLVFQDEYLKQENNRQSYMSSLELIRQMDLLLAISEASKKDAVNLLGIPEEKIVVINAGVDDQFLVAANEAHLVMSQKMQQENPYLLYIGGMDSRKNIDKAIQAFAINRAAREQNIRFIVAGRSSFASNARFTQIARRYGAADRVIFPGYVRDEDVTALYQNALGLLFPSRYEGFGLPVLEAMCCGTAVITSNTSSLVEVAEGYAYLVAPDSVESISEGITALLEAGVEADEQISAAKTYAKLYRWQRVAESTRDAILRLATQSKPTQSIPRPFVVESGMLSAIASRYSQFRVPFTWMDALKFAKALRRLESKTAEEGIRQGTRVFYDVAAPDAGPKASSLEISRISAELMRALVPYAEVVPVTLKQWQGQVSFVQMDAKTHLAGKTLIPREGDLYLVPEVRTADPFDSSLIQAVRAIGIKTYAIVYEMTQHPDEDSRRALQSYDGVLTVSRTVADELVKSMRLYPVENGSEKQPHVGVFPLGADHLYQQKARISRSIQRLFRAKSPIFLVVGSAFLSREHAFVMEAFSQLWQEGVDCKLCMLDMARPGEASSDADRTQQAASRKNVVYLNCVDDATLQYAYQHATALIEPSFQDGGGLAVIEAASNRLPIICSDSFAHHELSGEHAAYFSRDGESLAQCVREYLRLRELGQAPDSSKIDLFTWNEAANRVSEMIINDTDWTYRG